MHELDAPDELSDEIPHRDGAGRETLAVVGEAVGVRLAPEEQAVAVHDVAYGGGPVTFSDVRPRAVKRVPRCPAGGGCIQASLDS
jgi:hypothetical protein